METTISAPWYTYVKKLKELFKDDKNIEVSDAVKISDSEDDDGAFYQVDINVNERMKYEALRRVLISIKRFGNVCLQITVNDRSDAFGFSDLAGIFSAIFKDNPILRKIKTVDGRMGEHTYIVFEPEIIQFFDDDISDYYGNYNGLAEDIAREVFDVGGGVSFCTVSI